MQCGLLAVERVWENPENPFKSYNRPVPQPHDMGRKLIRITLVPHKSRSSKKRSRICLKKMYLHLGRHAGPVWILVSPRQMRHWARHVQVIPSPKSLTPGFMGVK